MIGKEAIAFACSRQVLICLFLKPNKSGFRAAMMSKMMTMTKKTATTSKAAMMKNRPKTITITKIMNKTKKTRIKTIHPRHLSIHMSRDYSCLHVYAPVDKIIHNYTFYIWMDVRIPSVCSFFGHHVRVGLCISQDYCIYLLHLIPYHIYISHVMWWTFIHS